MNYIWHGMLAMLVFFFLIPIAIYLYSRMYYIGKEFGKYKGRMEASKACKKELTEVENGKS